MGSDLKTLLILAGGIEAISGIKTAREMNLKVVVADGNPKAPGREFADDFIHVNIYNAKETLDAVKKYAHQNRIDGVITIAADNPLSVAMIADYFGLVGPSIETASISIDKLLMKDKFKALNIPIPWYRGVSLPSEISQILASRPSEYVLKPADSRGSRGVIRISDPAKVHEAWEFSKGYSTSGKLIIEEWMNGDQLSSESIVWKGKTYLCGLADRNYNRLDDLYPFVVEDGGETPSKYSPDIDMQIEDLMTRSANAIDLKKGTIKGDLIITQNGPVIIEAAVRLSGGYFSTDTIPGVYNYDIIRQLIKISLGEPPDLPVFPLINKKFQANRFLFLCEGKVTGIEIQEYHDEDLIFNETYVNIGDTIGRIDNHTKRGGMALALSNSRAMAIQICEKAMANVKVYQKPVN